MTLSIIFLVIFIALAFEYINGFHDTANSIATVVGTKVLTPRQAIALASITNLVGALAGHAVAKTVQSGLVDSSYVNPKVIICALLGGIVWNLITWWLGLPSSSTHALVGGICGATLANAHGKWSAILWKVTKMKDGVEVHEGVYYKVVVPMITSPIIGLVGGFIIMGFLYAILSKARPGFVNRLFGKLQIFSAGYMGFAHGLADAQKTMGVITLALVTATAAGTFNELPNWLGFLRMDKTSIAENAILTLEKKASPDQKRTAAKTLEAEAKYLKPGEFREAFLALAAVTYSDIKDEAEAKRVGDLTKETHQQIMTKENSRILPKIPLVGGVFEAKHTDWLKSLTKEMDAASAANKPAIVAAAKKTNNLSPDVPSWIKVICSITMACGTAAGGWRIIKTLGHKMVKLQPVHGFAAETTAATLLAVTGSFGMTVSTTHSVTTAIMGVGCAKRFNALKFSLIERIIWAWVLTLPAAGLVGYLLVEIFRFCHWME